MNAASTGSAKVDLYQISISCLNKKTHQEITVSQPKTVVLKPLSGNPEPLVQFLDKNGTGPFEIRFDMGHESPFVESQPYRSDGPPVTLKPGLPHKSEYEYTIYWIPNAAVKLDPTIVVEDPNGP